MTFAVCQASTAGGVREQISGYLVPQGRRVGLSRVKRARFPVRGGPVCARQSSKGPGLIRAGIDVAASASFGRNGPAAVREYAPRLLDGGWTCGVSSGRALQTSAGSRRCTEGAGVCRAVENVTGADVLFNAPSC